MTRSGELKLRVSTAVYGLSVDKPMRLALFRRRFSSTCDTTRFARGFFVGPIPEISQTGHAPGPPSGVFPDLPFGLAGDQVLPDLAKAGSNLLFTELLEQVREMTVN